MEQRFLAQQYQIAGSTPQYFPSLFKLNWGWMRPTFWPRLRTLTRNRYSNTESSISTQSKQPQLKNILHLIQMYQFFEQLTDEAIVSRVHNSVLQEARRCINWSNGHGYQYRQPRTRSGDRYGSHCFVSPVQYFSSSNKHQLHQMILIVWINSWTTLSSPNCTALSNRKSLTTLLLNLLVINVR